VIAFSSGVGGKLLRRSARTQRALNRFASLVFVALAAKLAGTVS
jgi:threonine/homoserine/homoserine lactone efflux protein